MIVEPDRLVAETVPDDALGLRFVVVSRDDVLNQKTTTFDFMISLFEVFGRLRFRKPLAATVRVSPVVVGVMLRQAVIDAKMRVSPALSRAGVITKSLLSWIKTDGGNR